MQFTLRSLLISFVVLASAIGAFGTWGIAVAAACLLAVACLQKARSMETASLVVGLILFIALIVYLAAAPKLQEKYRNIDACKNNLKQIAQAVLKYESDHGNLPPPYVVGPDKKPWHSWRVLMLPYLGRKDLFDSYNFKEPWNGPNNIKLARSMPEVFHCPNDKDSNGKSTTNYLAVVGPNTVWPVDKPISSKDIHDGAFQTILLVEMANSGVNWMEPRDLSFQQVCKYTPSTNPDLFAPHAQKGGLRYKWAGWSTVAYADGTIASLSSDYLADNFKPLLTRNGGEYENRAQDRGPVYDPNYIVPISFSEWSKIANIIVLVLSVAALVFGPVGRKMQTTAQED
jgi:Protein of unknown function (DUF1559)